MPIPPRFISSLDWAVPNGGKSKTRPENNVDEIRGDDERLEKYDHVEKQQNTRRYRQNTRRSGDWRAK